MPDQMPPGPPGSPPPMWMPMPVQPSRPNLRHMVTLWGRLLGFILIFLGTIIAVFAVSVPGGCITQPTSCGTNFAAQLLNGIIVAKALWVFGLFCIGGASGLKFFKGTQPQSLPKEEDRPWTIHERRMNLAVVLFCVVAMAVILLTLNVWPPIPGGTGYFP